MEVEHEARDEEVVPERNSAFHTSRTFFSEYWSWMAVITMALLLWLPRLSGPIDLRWDASVYYLLGTSLAQGHGYRIPSEPGSPAAVQYPPLLPGFVAAHQWLSGTTDTAVVSPRLRLSYAAMFVVYGLAVLALARRYLAIGFAVCATALCLLHHLTIFLSDLLFAELPFALLGVAFAITAVLPSRVVLRLWPREMASFIFAAAAFLLKTMGVALFAAWVADALLRRRGKLALMRGGLALLPIIAWQVYVARVQGSQDYKHPAYEYQRAAYQYSNVTYSLNAALINPFRPELGRMDARALSQRLAGNLPWLVMAVGETLSGAAETWPLRHLQARLVGQRIAPDTEASTNVAPIEGGSREPSFVTNYALIGIPLLAIAAIVALGLIILFRERAWLLFFIIAFALGLVWLTPWHIQFPRYLMPLMPFLAICAMLGFSHIYRSFPNSRNLRIVTRFAFIGLALICGAMHLLAPLKLFHLRASGPAVFRGNGIGKATRFFAHDRSWQDWEEAADWIRTRTPRDAIVATSAPHLLYLLTGRRAVLPPMEADRQREQQLLDGVPVAYVIIDQTKALDVTRRYALPAVDSGRGWQLAHAIHATRIYDRTGINTGVSP
ncbi:MAG: hypothetical protein DLM52_13095 [Chthoniobacterales bacterium]|nr:MAG: hypothetical protein DLM52_13095 [Chthoniobacterales bacterium]